MKFTTLFNWCLRFQQTQSIFKTFHFTRLIFLFETPLKFKVTHHNQLHLLPKDSQTCRRNALSLDESSDVWLASTGFYLSHRNLSISRLYRILKWLKFKIIISITRISTNFDELELN